MSAPQYKEPENLKARIKESYDAIAPEYNAWTIAHSPARLEYFDRLIALLRPATSTTDGGTLAPLRVLELGCGAGLPVTGRLLQVLAPVHVTGNDISTAQLDMARQSLGVHGEKIADGVTTKVDWVESDMMTLSFPDATFDAVLGLYSVIHLPREEQAEIIKRISQWLKPGTGYFLANFAEEPVPGVVMKNWLHEKGWMFWSGWGVDGTEAKLADAGLEKVISKVEPDSVDKANFHWVIARKPASTAN